MAHAGSGGRTVVMRARVYRDGLQPKPVAADAEGVEKTRSVRPSRHAVRNGARSVAAGAGTTTSAGESTRRRVPARTGAAAAPWLGIATLVVSLFAPARAAHANGFIQVRDDTESLIPTPADYDDDFVQVNGAFGLRVKNTGATGLAVLVRCADAAPQIALGDLLLRTPTPPGAGGSSMFAFTATSVVNQRLWSSGVPQSPFADIRIDVRIRNLFNYGGGTAGTATYQNTLTFTIIEP